MLIYEIDPYGYWTGRDLEVDDLVIPPGYVNVELPAVPAGKYARFMGDHWLITAEVPPQGHVHVDTPIQADYGRVMTQLAFKARIPKAKWKAAKAAAKAGNQDLEDFFEDWSSSSYIDQRRAAIALGMLMQPGVDASYRLTLDEFNFAIHGPVRSYELPTSLRLVYGFPEIPTDEELAV